MATVASYTVEQLAAWGVQRVYGVTGDTCLPLLDAIARHPSLRFVTVRHEAAAGFMASAEAKVTGRLTVCLATSGPGLGNLLNGLGDAWADRTPVLAITGQVERQKIGTDTKQYVDQQGLVRPMAGYTALLTDPAAAGRVLPAAMRAALSGGQVGHVSVPKDLWECNCPAEVTPQEPFLQAPPVPDPATLRGALTLMAGARRPLILAGLGARPAAAALRDLAERWGAGVLLSLPAKGALPWSHPLVLGGIGPGGTDAAHTALQEADLLLAVGCNWWPESHVPRRLPVIKVDRSAANVGGPMPVRYGVAGDVRFVLPALLEGLGGRPEDRHEGQQENRTGGPPENRPGGPPGTWSGALPGASSWDIPGPGPAGRATPHPGPEPWLRRLAELKWAWQCRVDQETADSSPPLSPQHIVRALERALPPDAVIALDTGDHTVWFSRVFGGERHEVLLSGMWRSLGCGVPAALAAKLARPDRTVAALVGDGGLQSLLGELVTAAELGLPVLIVVVNNGMMAIEHNRAVARGLDPLGTVLRNPAFAPLAEACGLKGYQARTAGELADALQAGLRCVGPALVEIFASSPVGPTVSG